jgi:uncharacterized DUF497 family protein
MDVAYRVSGIKFVWDRKKSELNRRKHGITFESACEIFSDPFISLIGTDVIRGEAREIAIGLTRAWQLLKVVYIFNSTAIRLISARTVTMHERENYEEQ